MATSVLGNPPRHSSRAAVRRDAFSIRTVLAIIGIHLLLGVGGALNRNVATVHAALTVIVSLIVTLGSRRPELIVATAAYGGVSDVYWRMTNSSAPWELSKYLLAFGAAGLFFRLIRNRNGSMLPVVFLLMLLPGMLLTLFADGVGTARDRISGTEMGLVAFALGALAFRHLVATQSDAWNLGWVVLGPLLAALAITTHALLTNESIDFTDESNFAATGGYGPNQVSAVLGLIILICVLLAFLPPARRLWPVMAGLSLWALWGTFLTFSRGGIYSAVLAGGAMLVTGVSTKGARMRSIVTLLVSLVALSMVFASANDFTGNWLDQRYQDSNTSGRTDIIDTELRVFGQHPILGVGSGRAREFRAEVSTNASELGRAEAASHTEFSRVLAEHGILGLAALALMIVMIVQAYRRSMSKWNRLMVVALSVWSLTTMLHASMRVGAVAVMLALTQLRVEGEATAQNKLMGPA